jgi:anti-sigma factor RsiW
METRPDSSLAEKLRDGSLYERAPAHLRAQVLAKLKEETDKEQRSKTSRRGRMIGLPSLSLLPFVSGGVAGICLCSLAFMTFFLTQAPSRSGNVEQEIVASHVRALISSRDIDVISTDQHTVKPWFNGRIDYAPPVVDPRAQGFPLVGGRLDYVDHRPVAVLVYRYLKHPIDLYVFPDKNGKDGVKATPLSTQTNDGYSLVEWRQDGMVYWAISDASVTYIKQFANIVRTANNP